jgi:hypothetical protein
MVRRLIHSNFKKQLCLLLPALLLFSCLFSQSTIFQSTSTPAYPRIDAGTPVVLGVKFRTTQSGYITGIRYYKGAGTTGTHLGTLWSNTGIKLAEATFTYESASGWQQLSFTNPVAVNAGTTYIASYFSPSGDLAITIPFFTQAVINGPLRALADGEDGHNGLYKYSSVSALPTEDYYASNFWVDVVFAATPPDGTAPTVVSVLPVNNAAAININTSVSALFSEALDATTVNSSSFELRNASNAIIPAAVSYNATARTATLTPTSALANSTVYTATLKGGSSAYRIKDIAGNALAADYSWSFTTIAAPVPQTSAEPILVITSSSNPFTGYASEILKAEGLNESMAMDISLVNATELNKYDVVVLGQIPVSASMVTLLTNWVNAGGTLITFHPDPLLAPLLGITPAGSSLADKYLLVNTATGPGAGIVNQTIQYHGSADLYTLIPGSGSTSLATLYSSATATTSTPAVTMRNVGVNGGRAIAFAYDLARSVVYTRQGNPAWAGTKRDGQPGPIRSDDLYFGNAAGDPQSDWVDFNKISIPQADEQQRLLANIILQSNLHRKPLPRFWYLPRGLKAAIIMTGDDHSNNGTEGRFNQYLSLGPNTPQDVADWKAIRGTSYIYTNTPISDSQAAAFEAQGFEIALHPNTGCVDYTPSFLEQVFSDQLGNFVFAYPSLSNSVTNRTHCLPWSDWGTHPKVELNHGIRMDVTYYYWPGSWVQNTSGMFTGSGLPMRFADLDGSVIDCYQAPTQMTDESGIDISNFCNLLLDKAIGPEGYYGTFVANMHTDIANHPGSNAIIASALARQVPVISAKQMLTWLDGRNNSSFGAMTWTNNQLSFPITAMSGANNLKAMLPLYTGNNQLVLITRNGSPIPFTSQTIKGILYAFFDVTIGTSNYIASYSPDNTAPVITNIVAVPNANGTAVITWTTNEPADSKVDYGIAANSLNMNSSDNIPVTSHSILLPGLTPGITYYFRVTSKDGASNSATAPVMTNAPLSFIVPEVCASDGVAANFNQGTTDANTIVSLEGDGAVILKPTLNEEFSGNAVPAGWTEGVFNPGATTVANGSVTVNGTHIYSNNNFAPGTSLEFLATFNSGAYQNIGFSVDQSFENAPWIMIGQGNLDGNLYARASDGSAVNIGSNLLGSAHRYRIKWNTTNFEFYVDGNATPAATINLAVASNMYIQISDVWNTDGMLSVDWMRATPYAAAGNFTSRVFDGGIPKLWVAASWNSDMPAGTSLAIAVRTGNTPTPDGTWSAYTTIGTSGGTIGSISRYIQYKADLGTTDPTFTPALKDITISCSNPVSIAPAITIHPASQTVCAESNVSFISAASGTPPPGVQWQVYANGVWTNINGATNNTLTFAPATADNNKQYRAVWTNSGGSINSNAAVLTVKAKPIAPTVTVSNSCGYSLLAASGYTGTLLWNNGVTTYYILTTNAATYTVTQTVNGCTSAAASGIAAPKAIPVAPTITVENNCGNSVLTASNYTGTLLWSNGATTPSITVTNAATYSVTQTVNGCTSESRSAVSAPKAIPSAPVAVAVNLCGSSVLTASLYTGSLLWSTGATTASITVTNAATYTVTQTVNGCTSPARSVLSLPLALPATPIILVNGATTFCQGGSVTLTSASLIGNVWSTGATTQSIVVTASGSYSVRTLGLNGCLSLYSEAKVVTVNPKPVLSGGLTKTITSGTSVGYTPSSTTPGTTFTWSRAAVNGISNAAATGTGSITETLLNITSSPVNVTYVYTLTANGCTNTQSVVVTVNPLIVQNCVNNTSMVSSFNSTPIPAGRYLWLNSVFDPGSFGTTGDVNFYVTNARVSAIVSGQYVYLDLPNSHIRFSSNVTTATTQYISNVWETQVPLNFTGNVFMDGLSYQLPGDMPGSLSNITWSATVASDMAGVSYAWKWSAAVYSVFSANAGLNIKPVDGSVQNLYANADRAGTPENYKQYVAAGAKGNGGTNYTGDYSAIATVSCNSLFARQSSIPEEQIKQPGQSEQPKQLTEKSPAGTKTNPMAIGWDVHVMPNPSSTGFTLIIDGDNKSPATIRVLNIFGQVVEKHEKIASHTAIRLGGTWTGGIYFAEIVQGDQRKLVKMIKTN